MSAAADATREKKKVVYGKKRQAPKKMDSDQTAEAAQEAEAAQKEAEVAEQRRIEEVSVIHIQYQLSKIMLLPQPDPRDSYKVCKYQFHRKLPSLVLNSAIGAIAGAAEG